MKRFEPYLFYFLIIVNLIPILIFKFFPTMDGPAHLHNSNLIVHLFFNHESPLHQFYSFNPEIVPNWTGHFLLAFFNAFLPAYIAEKIVLVMYVAGLPIIFRYFIKNHLSKDIYLSYLIFPFIYTFPFILGFYNFSLGIVLMLICLEYWISHQDKLNYKNKVIFFLLITMLYLTHLFLFGIFTLTLGCYVLWNFLLYEKTINLNTNFKIVFNKILFLFSSYSFSFFLLLTQFMGKSRFTGDALAYNKLHVLVDWLVKIRSIIGYNFHKEGMYNTFIFLITTLFIVGAFIKRYKKNFRRDKGTQLISFINKNDVWFLIGFIFLVLYFVLPDHLPGKGGHLSTRIQIFIYLFFIIWITGQHFSKLTKSIGISIIITFNILTIAYYTSTIKKLNGRATEVYQASKKIEANSIVLPINVSDYWLDIHFSNYLGIEKPMVILENYETSQKIFPLIWDNNLPDFKLVGMNQKEIGLFWPKSDNATSTKNIEYVFIKGENPNKEKSLEKLFSLLESHGKLIHSTKRIKLFKINE